MGKPAIGLNCPAAGGPNYGSNNLSMALQYLGVSINPMGQVYLDPGQAWTSGMSNSYYAKQIIASNCALGMVSVPPLVGVSVGTKPSNSGTGQTASPQTPGGATPTLGADAAAGDTSISSSIAFPAGSKIVLGTGASQELVTTTGASTGAGPYAVPVPALAYAHAAGAAIYTLMTLADVAAGIWDGLFTPVFTTIKQYRPDAILRIAWELYGNGRYPWNGLAIAADLKAAYQHLVDLARSISATFTYAWDGGAAQNGYDPKDPAYYPGDNYVDFVTADTYSIGSSGGVAGWTNSSNNGAQFFAAGLAFAKTHGKPFGIPEFGISNFGDDPLWVSAALDWVQANSDYIAFANYHNQQTSKYDPRLSLNPLSAERLLYVGRLMAAAYLGRAPAAARMADTGGVHLRSPS